MQKIHPSTGDSTLDAVLRCPVRIIPYADAPEVVHSSYASDSSPHIQQVEAKILGLRTSEKTYRSAYSAVPDSYVHTLNNVYTYRSIVLSVNGGIFIDNFRTHLPNNTPASRYSVLDDHFSSDLGNYQYCIKKHNIKKLAQVDELVTPLYSNISFGHWILETLPLLVSALQYGRPKFLRPFPSRKPPAFFFQLAKNFNISESDFIEQQAASQFKNMLLISKPFMIWQYVSNTAKKIWLTLAEKHASTSGRSLPKKVYISRKTVQNRPLLNERECEQLFEYYGFTSISPEQLDIYEQISLFSNASHVAGPIGSAMHSIIFSLRPTDLKVLFLTPENFHAISVCSLIEAAFGRTPYCVFGNHEHSAQSTRPLRERPWTIDLENLKAAIPQWLDS